MLPIDRTLGKERFFYRYFFIILEFQEWRLGDNIVTTEIKAI